MEQVAAKTADVTEFAKYLVKKRADVNERVSVNVVEKKKKKTAVAAADEEEMTGGDTPLLSAVRNGDGAAELVNYLLNKRARVFMQDKNGNTPKHISTERNFPALDVLRAELMTGVCGACMYQQTLRGSFSGVSKPIFATKH